MMIPNEDLTTASSARQSAHSGMASDPRHIQYGHTPSTPRIPWRLRWLYKIRQWIDRRVPRDMLVIEIRIDGKPYWIMNHLEGLRIVAYSGGYEGHTFEFDRPHRIDVLFRVEHLA